MDFDWKFYIKFHEDLKLAGIDNEEKATQHYITHGIKENRFPNKLCSINDLNIEENLDLFYENIDNFSNLIRSKKNILFICSDYPGYGGAATNCINLLNYYKQTHNVYGIFWTHTKLEDKIYINTENYKIVNQQNKLFGELLSLNFVPDLIILKSDFDINLKEIFECPIYFFIPGIYKDYLDKSYKELITKSEHNKYINLSVINQIKNSDISFSNSNLTKNLLKNIYNLETNVFYSGFIHFYKQEIFHDPDFASRPYDYGLIVSNFDRKIKNIQGSIDFLKDKKNVILIGKGSEKYEYLGFLCIELVNNIKDYYKQIKYIVQHSHFESYSNVKIESTYLGCKIIN